MMNLQSVELTKPCFGTLYDPFSFTSSEFHSISVTPCLVALSIGYEEIDSALLKPLSQRIEIVTKVGYYPFRLPSLPTFWLRHTNFGEHSFRKPNLSRRGTLEVNSQRKTLTVERYHPLRVLVTPGFTYCGVPSSEGAKLPIRKISSYWSRPSGSNAPSSVHQASGQTHSYSHYLGLNQQVDHEGNSLGRKRRAAPAYMIQRMPTTHAPFEAHSLH